MQLRRQQQEELDRKAREAAERKKLEPPEPTKKKKKPVAAVPKVQPAGFNPMQPWTASQGGGGYKYVHSCLPLAVFPIVCLSHFSLSVIVCMTDLKSARFVVDEDRSPVRNLVVTDGATNATRPLSYLESVFGT